MPPPADALPSETVCGRTAPGAGGILFNRATCPERHYKNQETFGYDECRE
jgi:hypothetical protein